MRLPTPRVLFAIVLCGCFIAGNAPTPLLGAPVSQQHIERLQKLRNRIQDLQNQLLKTREQRDETRQQLQLTEKLGRLPGKLPRKFLSSLSSMPEVAGIALGVDRLAMVLWDKLSIDEVVPFIPEDL